jgi:hypothetical protein
MSNTEKKIGPVPREIVEISSNHSANIEKATPKFVDAAEYLLEHQSQYSAYSLQDAKKVVRKVD